LAEALDHVSAVAVAGRIVIEDEHQAAETSQGCGAQMGEVGNAGHLDLDGHCNLAFDLFCASARPLRDDLHVVSCW
jgi:hypothetical protein